MGNGVAKPSVVHQPLETCGLDVMPLCLTHGADETHMQISLPVYWGEGQWYGDT
jgi:hypothetical protein